MSPTDPITLWRTLSEYIRACFSLWGEPRVIAGKLWLDRAEHQRASGFLAALEHVLRRLLYLDAVKLTPKPPAPRRARAAIAAPNPRGGGSFDAEHPESWRCKFQVLPRQSKRAPARRRTTHAGADVISSAPVALRLEALIRAFNDPAPYAERLARALAKRAGADQQARARACFTRTVPFTQITRLIYPTLEEVTALTQRLHAEPKSEPADDDWLARALADSS